ncbi:sigma-54-dependent Fis family transcriptional regulator [Rhodococcus qingshengii]
MMEIVDDTDGGARRRLRLGDRETQAGGADEFVAASWIRSQAAGVSPHGGDIRFIGDVDVASRLVHYARPVLEKLIEYTEDIPLSIAISDNKGRVLSRLDTNSTIGARVDTISLSPGFSYAESEVGTNGVGTVLESGRSVHIVGAAHFHERFQKYSCSGAPIRDPLSGHIEGVLDLTCLVEHSTPLLHSFVRSAASTIETALLHDRELNQRILFNAFSKMEAKTRLPLLVAGKNVLISTSRAQKLLDSEEQRAIVQHALYLAERAPKVTEEIELSSRRTVKMRTTRISSGKTVVGVGVVIVDLVNVHDMPNSGSLQNLNRSDLSNLPTAASGLNSGTETNENISSSWRRATFIARKAIENDDLVAVIGEPGSGRVRMIKEIILGVRPNVELIEVKPGFDNEYVKKIVGMSCDQPIYLLFDGAEQLSFDEINWIASILADGSSNEYFIRAVAVISDYEDRPESTRDPLRALLRIFRTPVHVPPLRHRAADLPFLVREILNELFGGEAPNVSLEVIEKLSGHSWPGNVSELRDVLSKCLENRSSPTIEVGDIPIAISRIAIQSSGMLETVERETIKKALEENGGNRVRAAKDLGIARSSLYRKMKTYKI